MQKKKVGGPLLDRLDIHIEVPAVPFQQLTASEAGTSSAAMRDQVAAARAAQEKRFSGSRTLYNARMNSRQIRAHCVLDSAGHNLLKNTLTELGLSARAHDKILRVARTIADLDNSPKIEAPHLNEAINYRMLDRQLWT